MVLKPLGGRVVVEPIEESEKVVGGIVLPETAAERPTEGRVIAVGSGTLLDSGQRLPIDVKEGDTVVYGKYAGSEITLEGTDYKILSADDILAVREG